MNCPNCGCIINNVSSRCEFCGAFKGWRRVVVAMGGRKNRHWGYRYTKKVV